MNISRTLLLALIRVIIATSATFAVDVPASAISNMLAAPAPKAMDVEPPRPISAAASKS